jgi:hypothetical protein
MKKFITLITVIALCLPVIAQTHSENKRKQKEGKSFNKEERIEKKCKTITEKLMLDDATAATFKPLYKAYLNELSDNFKVESLPDRANVSDADVDKSIKNRFEKIRKSIDIREKYYNEFRKFLTAKQAKIALNARGKKHAKTNFSDNVNRRKLIEKRLEFNHDKKRLNENQNLKTE